MMAGKPTFKDRIEYAGLAGTMAALRALPLGAARSVGKGLGSMVARTGLRKQVALENLALAFPQMSPREHEGVYTRMCRLMGVTLAEFSKLGDWSPDDLRQHIRFANPEPLAQAAALGKGGMLLSGHFGNWELLCAASSLLSSNVAAIGGRQRNPLVEEMINRVRASGGVQALTVRTGLKEAVRHIRAGGLVATLADQDGGRDGIFADFFGLPASVRPGVFRLAVRLNTPVVMGYTVRKGDEWEIHLEELIIPSDIPGTQDEVTETLIRRFNSVLEKAVSNYPDHWFWVHRRWKTRPE